MSSSSFRRSRIFVSFVGLVSRCLRLGSAFSLSSFLRVAFFRIVLLRLSALLSSRTVGRSVSFSVDSLSGSGRRESVCVFPSRRRSSVYYAVLQVLSGRSSRVSCLLASFNSSRLVNLTRLVFDFVYFPSWAPLRVASYLSSLVLLTFLRRLSLVVGVLSRRLLPPFCELVVCLRNSVSVALYFSASCGVSSDPLSRVLSFLSPSCLRLVSLLSLLFSLFSLSPRLFVAVFAVSRL
ncbi:hypothetical protein Tco_0382186 [Tanacetum coccineum]